MKIKLLFAGICVMLFGMFLPTFNVSAEELEEQTGYVTDPEYAFVIEEIDNSSASINATAHNLNWTVSAGARKVTSSFYMSKGDYIVINVTLSKSAKVGIVEPSGTYRCVTGKSINHPFKLSSAGYYKVFIQNDNSTSITSSGTYTN